MVSQLLQKLEADIARIQAESSVLYIVNAGRMNHGKSSLFNSLLDKVSFAVNDIRTTVQCAEAEFEPDVMLVDTPGLDADTGDDTKAFDAYRKANMIIFVHTSNVGELHKDELDRINAIASLFPSREYFWKHFCLVITFKDAVEEKQYGAIKKKIQEDVFKQCQGKKFPIFYVSNTRYQNGKNKNKEGLIKQSGIGELKEFLKENISQWRSESAKLQEDKIHQLRQEALKQLEKEKKVFQAKINSKKNEVTNRQSRLVRVVSDSFSNIENLQRNIESNQQELRNLENAKRSLEEQHHRERY